MERQRKRYRSDEKKIHSLFKELDVNRDGRVDVQELSDGLKRLGIPNIPGQAEAVVSLGDQNKDGHIDFQEFVDYIRNHEEKLWLTFTKLDLNEDGEIDREELKRSLIRLGISTSDQEIDKLLKKIDSDGNLAISWDEWREFLLLQPHTSMRAIMNYWKHATVIDISEADNLVIPADFSKEDRVSGMWWRQLCAGGAAGAVSRTCTAPLDRLKIFFMVSSMQSQQFTIVSGLQHMVKEGGLRSLWRGNGVNVIKIAPESAIRFFAYEQMKRLLKDGDEPLQVHERLLAGSSAGVIAQTSIYPLELTSVSFSDVNQISLASEFNKIYPSDATQPYDLLRSSLSVMKTRLALGKTGQYKGLLDCARQLLKSEGVFSFYKGLTPSLLGIIPYAGIDLAVYETLKGMWMHREGWENSGVVVPLACGTLSSTCGQLASYPLSLVRTRLQAQVGAASDEGSRLSMIQTFQNIWSSEGLRGLYRGLLPNFLKVAPAVSVAYVMYEQIKRVLGVPTVK